ncbi:MAG: molecular chaperone DnaK, partial [Desulfatitalea sp.]|nr:molecular chaperone DnaK [Desulfatitalea sp.]
LQFQLRDNTAPATVGEEVVLDDSLVQAARCLVQDAFDGDDAKTLSQLVKTIATAVDLPRDQWPLTLIRNLAGLLVALMPARAKSPAHEARWMNIIGFCLRPGFGDSLDAERIKRIWKLEKQGPAHPKQQQVASEWWILWRRLAGGLGPGQQRQLSQELSRLLNPKKGKASRLPLQHQLELWMCVANLERLYVKDKIQWGRLLLAQLQPRQARPQHLWSVARLGARELLYGSVDRVIPSGEAARWIDDLLAQPWPQPKLVGPALAQLARKTGDRTRDVDDAVAARILDWMAPHDDLAHHRRYLTQVVPMAHQEEQTLFGESLPLGIMLHDRSGENLDEREKKSP